MLKFPKVELRVPTIDELRIFSDAEKDEDISIWIGINASFEWHLSKLRDPNVKHLAVVRDGRAVGYMTIVPHEGGNVELLRGMTLPEFRGRYGVSWFVSSVNYAFQEMNAERVWCDVKENNFRAIKIYKKVGFEEVDAPPVEVSTDTTGLLVMMLSREKWLSLNLLYYTQRISSCGATSAR